jgi:predicted transcriptional regulator
MFHSVNAIIAGMMTPSSLFGSVTRTRLLVAVMMLERAYVAELAVMLGKSSVTIWRMVQALESEDVLATYKIGNARMVELNSRNVAVDGLRSLLLVLARRDPALMEAAATLRRSPRKIGKPA